MAKKYFRISPFCDEGLAVVDTLKQKELYRPDLLYRAFGTNEGGKKIVSRILRGGTDRFSQASLSPFNDEVYDLDPEDIDDKQLRELARTLKPNDYIWMADEENIHEEIIRVDLKRCFVSVYDPSFFINLYPLPCFAFKEKKHRSKSLVALIELV